MTQYAPEIDSYLEKRAAYIANLIAIKDDIRNTSARIHVEILHEEIEMHRRQLILQIKEATDAWDRSQRT